MQAIQNFAKLAATGLVAFALNTAPLSASDFSWDGTWSGRSESGKLSTFKIAKQKVVSWTWSGQRQRITRSSVSAKKVTVSEKFGGHATLTPMKDGRVSYSWRKGSDRYKQILQKN